MLVLKLIHVTALDSSSFTDFHPWSECDENRGISVVVKRFCDTGPRFKYIHMKGILFHVSTTQARAEKNAHVIWTQRRQWVSAPVCFPQPVDDLTWCHCMGSQASSMSLPCPAPGNTPCGIRRRIHSMLISISAQCGPLYGMAKHCFRTAK